VSEDADIEEMPEIDDGKAYDSVPDNPHDEISFSSSENYCVGLVDIVNSTEVIASLRGSAKTRKFLSTFINSMAIIVRNFGGTVVKNVGDSLVFYFPETSNSDCKDAFKNVLECFRAMVDARPIINTKLYQGGLPPVNYRISGDYGIVELARSSGSRKADLFGPTMMLCSKMNRMAQTNGIIIGEDLYRMMHHLKLKSDGCRITDKGAYSSGLKFAYPVYHVEMIGIDTTNPFKRRAREADKERSKSAKENPAKIMIVDDDPDALQTFKTFLDNEKYDVDAFSNGEKALNKLATVKPDHYNLVITDIRMEPINGLELYERISRINPRTKILFVSALDATPEILSLFSELKGYNILRKPTRQEEFISTIEGLLS